MHIASEITLACRKLKIDLPSQKSSLINTLNRIIQLLWKGPLSNCLIYLSKSNNLGKIETRHFILKYEAQYTQSCSK